jgi:hypothetical protein
LLGSYFLASIAIDAQVWVYRRTCVHGDIIATREHDLIDHQEKLPGITQEWVEVGQILYIDASYSLYSPRGGNLEVTRAIKARCYNLRLL